MMMMILLKIIYDNIIILLSRSEIIFRNFSIDFSFFLFSLSFTFFFAFRVFHLLNVFFTQFEFFAGFFFFSHHNIFAMEFRECGEKSLSISTYEFNKKKISWKIYRKMKEKKTFHETMTIFNFFSLISHFAITSHHKKKMFFRLYQLGLEEKLVFPCITKIFMQFSVFIEEKHEFHFITTFPLLV